MERGRCRNGRQPPARGPRTTPRPRAKPGGPGPLATRGRDRDVPGAKLKVSPIRQYFPDSARFTKIYPHRYPHHKIFSSLQVY